MRLLQRFYKKTQKTENRGRVQDKGAREDSAGAEVSMCRVDRSNQQLRLQRLTPSRGQILESRDGEGTPAGEVAETPASRGGWDVIRHSLLYFWGFWGNLIWPRCQKSPAAVRKG